MINGVRLFTCITTHCNAGGPDQADGSVRVRSGGPARQCGGRPQAQEKHVGGLLASRMGPERLQAGPPLLAGEILFLGPH